MSWRTNPLILQLRNLGRTIGVNRRLAVLLNGKEYEARYDKLFSATLRPGDKVWDVGANVGYYTRQFSERVGSAGKVFAFEPSPTNFERLCSACKKLDNVQLFQIGLGSEEAVLPFLQGSDGLGATSRVVTPLHTNSNDDYGEQNLVKIRTGLGLVESGEVLAPNVVKINVEGFEGEVLKGIDDLLCSPELRSMGIEVHFRILKERGMAEIPSQIEQLLIQKGFHIQWPDSSHLFATRSEA
jgi:FkbM family methyltransferase